MFGGIGDANCSWVTALPRFAATAFSTARVSLTDCGVVDSSLPRIRSDLGSSLTSCCAVSFCCDASAVGCWLGAALGFSGGDVSAVVCSLGSCPFNGFLAAAFLQAGLLDWGGTASCLSSKARVVSVGVLLAGAFLVFLADFLTLFVLFFPPVLVFFPFLVPLALPTDGFFLLGKPPVDVTLGTVAPRMGMSPMVPLSTGVLVLLILSCGVCRESGGDGRGLWAAASSSSVAGTVDA